MSYKISVITPVYNVEAFISRCIISLMKQTLDEIEYIFVDDASPDSSIGILQEILNRYPERNSHVRLIRHDKNLGLPAARNSGLEVASGDYIFHCDSDDFVEKDMLETMYKAAVMNNADIVYCDWYLSFKNNERYMKQPECSSSMEALKSMLRGIMKYNVWNKLVKRCLYKDNNIIFPAGYGMGEDLTMVRLVARAEKIVHIPEAFYHYVQSNTGAFSKTYSERHLLELRHNVSMLTDDLYKIYGSSIEREIAFLKLDVKYPFLISDDPAKYALWQEWYPEANEYICQNRYVSPRRRYIQWLAWKKQFWAIRIYYRYVHHIIYGLIYR